MTVLIGVVALVAIMGWLFTRVGPRPAAAPEDDVVTPVDRAELAAAERELAEADGAEALGDDEGEDDWGPGAR